MTIAQVLSQDDFEALDAVSQNAFQTLVQLDGSERLEDGEGALELSWEASVLYEGEVAGEVLIRCSESFGELFAERLMQIPRPKGFDADVRDSLGELANTIGGNYKTLLPSSTKLSIPTVELSSERRGQHGCVLAKVSYQTEIGACEVSLLEPAL